MIQTMQAPTRFRLHLESQRRQPAAMHFSEKIWQTAAARYPALAARVEVTFGWDGQRFEQPLDGLDFLLASRFPHAVVNQAEALKWVHTTGAGVDQLMPLDALRHDMLLTNSSGIHGDKAMEYVQMALLMLNTGLPAVMDAQRAHRWAPRLTPAIRGKTVAVIGFGDLGIAAARAARALGLRVVALNRSGRLAAGAPDDAAALFDALEPVEQLDTVLPVADFVVVTAPLTAATRGLLNCARLALMQPEAGLINISRAALIDHACLFERLRRGECGGAVIDVFDPEPLSADAVEWDVPGLMVTPHISCDVPDYSLRVLDLWFRNFERLLSDQPLLNRVDVRLGY
jgi:phosphoglycerate dehydrogenase-like enzyme